ncbi:uncharacterized protein MELLADRAFT_124287 [Melampsora larici-populina 98AG31]|uniref:Secreted protein n=1 Tax=Melampsora larici-populina (strain 98AG31 / pathotype 3-4-7) TaxID=747676 RepID=F4RL71_MELLP|nr:uncharacterized protein MELLADRAFT_124287 [Melampsora larici-populina 98AG31]EGG06855.1 secreted protein [Melampsora larici-populina 98AG31]
MLSLVKVLVSLVAFTYSVSATSVAAPTCTSSNSVIPDDCRSALASFLETDGLIIEDTPSDQKSCHDCQVFIESANKVDNLRFSGEGAREALQLILNKCSNGYGTVAIPELPVPGTTTVPAIISIEKGSGSQCEFLTVSVGKIPTAPPR